ncbi:MAG: STAS domain-containing protein [Candidatus Sericytochromatia bacterium]|nr:STAS domain-containing protein [Candidatus Sericytochromatia bacterium]
MQFVGSSAGVLQHPGSKTGLGPRKGWPSLRFMPPQASRLARLEWPLPGLRLSGPLDRKLAEALKAAARELTAQRVSQWQLDLAAVTRWDAEGVAALVHALDLAELNGQGLVLVSPPPALRRVFEQAQLHRLFAIVENIDPA